VLQLLGTIAYQSIYVSPAVLLGHFARVGDRMRAYRFITAFWVSAVLALLLFATMPAVGPLAYFVHGPLPYLPDSERYMADLIPALRLHEIHLIDLGAIRGLVSAPSFHTASAILFIATAWPHRMLRWPLTAMNVAMLVSTPVEGTHYLTDMIVGAAVAGIGLLAAAQLFQRLARRDQAGSTAISVTP
ncbi:MAG: phosphatase PAP2 family protein, partial [Sphingomonas sp.]